MLYRIIFLFFFGSLTAVFSQERSIEDIRKECQRYIDSMVNSHNRSSDWYVKTGKRMIEISNNKKALDSFNLTGYSFLYLGYYGLRQNDSVEVTLKQVSRKFKDNPALIERFPEIYYNSHISITNFFLKSGLFYKAHKVILEVKKNTDSIALKDGVGKLKINQSNTTGDYVTYHLGRILLHMGNYEEAEQVFRKSLSSFSVKGTLKNGLYAGMGHVFQKKNLDSALYYYKKADSFYIKYPIKYLRYLNDLNIAEVLIKKGDIDQAEKLLLKAKEFFIQDDQSESRFLGSVYQQLAKIAQIKNNSDQEYTYLKKSEKYFINVTELRRLENLYINLSSLYRKKKMFDTSYIYTKKAGVIRDSIFGIKKAKAIAEIETQYKIEKKESEITSQKQLISTQKKQTMGMAIGISILLLMLGVSSWLYRQKLKTQKKLLTNQEALSNERMNSILEAHKLHSIKEHINGQNKERERIAKDLHDSISGNLAAVKLKLSKLTFQTKEIENIVESVDSTYKEVRTISHNLVPKKISLDNFTDLLQQLISFREIEGLEMHTEFFPKEELNRLQEKTQIEIYRIIQEALTNIHKHSKASKGSISITHHDDYINVIIYDNGIGFETTSTSHGIGLHNIYKRVESCKGTLHIESKINRGTTININIPI